MNTESLGRQMLNKVPEITIFFWVIKILCTTVGETAADFLNTSLGLGLNGTSLVMGAILLVVLAFQFKARQYKAGIYWLAVVLLSIVGTLITDNLTDNLGISLVTTTIVFAIILAIVFWLWHKKEGTLSITQINTRSREAYYWLTILFTFALGTAAGDLIAERFSIGYLPSALIFAGVIALIALARYLFKLNVVLSFWLAYILTRPLGASIGDYLSQDKDTGGLGLGATMTSVIFLVAILATVIYLIKTRRDTPETS